MKHHQILPSMAGAQALIILLAAGSVDAMTCFNNSDCLGINSFCRDNVCQKSRFGAPFSMVKRYVIALLLAAAAFLFFVSFFFCRRYRRSNRNLTVIANEIDAQQDSSIVPGQPVVYKMKSTQTPPPAYSLPRQDFRGQSQATAPIYNPMPPRYSMSENNGFPVATAPPPVSSMPPTPRYTSPYLSDNNSPPSPWPPGENNVNPLLYPGAPRPNAV